MKRASKHEKNLVIEILARSFDTNSSVNYIIKQDTKRANRMRALMDYCFEVCNAYGDVFLSDDNTACALIMYPEKKKAIFASMWLDCKLLFQCVGAGNIGKVIKREKLIKSIQPGIRMSYLWFVGVHPGAQHKGTGSNLLREIIEYSNENKRPVYLETSTVRNLPWYKKFGFEIYGECDFTYHLYFLKRDIRKVG